MTMRRTTAMVVGGLVALAPAAWAADGAAVFKAQCAKCHGESGMADTPAAKTLKVPQMHGDAKLAAMSVDDIVKKAKANEKHKSFINKISDDDLTAAAGVAKQLAGSK